MLARHCPSILWALMLPVQGVYALAALPQTRVSWQHEWVRRVAPPARCATTTCAGLYRRQLERGIYPERVQIRTVLLFSLITSAILTATAGLVL